MWPWPEGPDLLTSPEDYVLAIKIVALVVATQPLTNVIVKFRADYTPKPVQLHADPEDNADASPSTNGVSSVFQMAKRVFQIEGVNGFFKGCVSTVPVVVISFCTSYMVIWVAGLIDGPFGSRKDASLFIRLVSIMGCFTLPTTTIPFKVVIYRAITTPHKLGWFNARRAVGVLFSPTERRKPWIIYCTPGLFITNSLHAILYFPAVKFYELLDYGYDDGRFLVYMCFIALITTPLEVIETRLCIQRNHAASTDFSQLGEGAATGEGAITYRSEDDPYLGLLDCARRITREEGGYILFRAWWLPLGCALIIIYVVFVS